jgi:hypothetical protein
LVSGWLVVEFISCCHKQFLQLGSAGSHDKASVLPRMPNSTLVMRQTIRTASAASAAAHGPGVPWIIL